jgi:hypothetical protein
MADPQIADDLIEPPICGMWWRIHFCHLPPGHEGPHQCLLAGCGSRPEMFEQVLPPRPPQPAT